MEFLSKFLDNPTSNATIIIVVALIVIIPNIPVIAKYLPIFKANFAKDTNEKKYSEIENHLKVIEGLYKDNKKFQENHSMHEIPEIKENVEKIHAKLDKFLDVQIEQGKEIAKHGEAIAFLKRHVGIKE
jgi:hypothetical protein